MSSFRQRPKKQTYPTLKVWQEAEKQPSAADILFGDIDVPGKTMEERPQETNKNSAAYVLFNDRFPQKNEKEKEEITPYPTLAVWPGAHQAQSKQENRVAKVPAKEQKNLTAQAQVNRPRQVSSKPQVKNPATQAESTKQEEKPPLQVANAKPPTQAEKSQPEVKTEATGKQSNAERNVGTYIYPIPQYAQAKGNPKLSKYSPKTAWLNRLGYFAFLDPAIMQDIGSIAEGVAIEAAASQGLKRLLAHPAKFVARYGAAAALPTLELANIAVRMDAETGIPYDQAAIDKIPQSIAGFKEKYAKLENEKITFLDALEGYKNGNVKKYQLPNHYLYFDGKELTKTQEGKRYFELMKNLPDSEIDSNGYLSVYCDDFAQGALNGEEWVNFASEQMQFRPGRREEMLELEQIIQGFEAELEGQIRTKEDYFQAMLEEIWPEDQLQKELAVKIINTSPENPYNTWQIMYNQAKYDKDVDKIHALESIRKGIVRVSKNTELGKD